MGKYSLNDFTFNGKYRNYCWDTNYNPNATIENGLANCTTLAYAFSYIHHLPVPVSRIVSASNWNKVLINGWSEAKYGSRQLKVGDIIQWVGNCHVATVIDIKEGEAILGCSWYTGIHGTSVYNGKYDTRDGINSLQQLSDFMSSKYPYRMYHECTLYEEAQRVGGMPENILVAPETVKPVKRNKSVNQIQVLTDEQYIRNNDNDIVGVARSGYYNVYLIKNANGYDWYEVANDRYIAGVDGRVVYLPAESEVEELKAEIERLRNRLDEISKLSVWR